MSGLGRGLGQMLAPGYVITSTGEIAQDQDLAHKAAMEQLYQSRGIIAPGSTVAPMTEVEALQVQSDIGKAMQGEPSTPMATIQAKEIQSNVAQAAALAQQPQSTIQANTSQETSNVPSIFGLPIDLTGIMDYLKGVPWWIWAVGIVYLVSQGGEGRGGGGGDNFVSSPRVSGVSKRRIR